MKPWPECTACDGSGLDWGETCLLCGGKGRDPNCCEKCDQPGVGFNDDGVYLCGDCLLDEVTDNDLTP